MGDFNQFKHRQLCNSFNLKQVVKHATRGTSILDKVFTNISKYYNDAEVVPPLGFSDHNSVLFRPLKHYKNSRSYRMVRDTRFSNRRFVGELLSNVNWTPMYRMESCNEQFQYFSFIVDGIVEKHFPLRRIKTDSSDKPWVTSEIKGLISKRQAAWARGNNIMFRFYRNKVNTLCKRARSRYYNNNVADIQQSNTRKWWSTVKNIAGLSPSKNISTLVYDGQPYSDTALANLFNDKFVAIGNTLPSLDWTPLPIDDLPIDFYISIDDTKNALMSTKLHSAAGPDEISAWFLRENASSLCRPLSSIFNASVREGFVPSMWKSANVTPVPKSSPALDVDSDFRPISLTPIVSKILESFPYKWLLQSTSEEIDKLQFGSLKGSNTTMALIYMLHNWYEAMDTPGALLRICTLDFSKAFDRIDYNILLHKLIRMKVHPVLINWIANFLTDRQQRTRVGSHYSNWKTINAGVPQGTKLGPLLFLIMANDLKVSDNTVKYVDDTTIWEVLSKGLGLNSDLPSQIVECTNWALNNNMKLNPTKTKELRICFSSQAPVLSPIVIDDQDIDAVPHVKLLGLMISEDLKWNHQVDYICKKAAKRLYALRLLKRCTLSEDVLVRVFCTCIRPILEYSCEVWHYCLPQYLSDEIEIIQRRAFRIIFPSFKYQEAMVAAGVVSLFERRQAICQRLFGQMRTEKSHKLHACVPPKYNTGHFLRSTNSLQIPSCRTNRFANSFIPAATKAYNRSII